MAKIGKQKTKGVTLVPLIMHLEALECGAACLSMVMAYYGKWVPLEQVRIDCGVSRNGSTAGNIARAAEKYGLKVKGYALTCKSLREKAKFPAIIHWSGSHFVVLNGFKGNKAIINDPAKGLVEEAKKHSRDPIRASIWNSSREERRNRCSPLPRRG